MPIKTEYLDELSNLHVKDLRNSTYYSQVPENERRKIELQLKKDQAAGYRPLLPGANRQSLIAIHKAFIDLFDIELPTEVLKLLNQVDGFIENGVTFYGIDAEYQPDPFEAGPGLVEENVKLWQNNLETQGHLLFLGDSDLWYFGCDLTSGQCDQYVALDRRYLNVVHRFPSASDLMNSMLEQALGLSFSAEEEGLD
jgi:hypothetical protein